MNKIYRYSGYFLGFCSIILIGGSYFLQSLIVFFFGVALLLISIFTIIIMMVVELYQKEKILDYELIKKSNFTIVVCDNCHKENVLQDQYCVKCGERLQL